jgi:serine protease AprX
VDSAGLAQGETFEATVDVPEGKSLLVNLVYMDAPGTAAAAVALVNNLDLMVQDKVSDSKVNNHEIVEIKNASAGNYKIVVKATNVPMGKGGKQPFALVYTVL